MARSNFKILSVEEKFVTVTDGTKFQGELNTFTCDREGIEAAEVNDIISASTVANDTTIVVDGFLEHGKNAVKPVPLEVKPAVSFNPNDTGDAQYTSPDGVLTNRDIHEMFQAQDKLIRDLAARVRVIEVRQPRHCDRCAAHLVENAFARP